MKTKNFNYKYVSPINITYRDEFIEELKKASDEYVMGRVNMYVDVNEEELIKALAYDRGQYEQGYKDGYDKGVEDGVNKMFEKMKELLSERGADNG